MMINLVMCILGACVTVNYVMRKMDERWKQQEERKEQEIDKEQIASMQKEKPTITHVQLSEEKPVDKPSAKPVPESVGAPRMPSFSQIATREMVVAQLVNSVSPNFIVDKRAMELLMNRQTRISHDVDMTTMQDCITIRTADGGVVDIKGIQWSDGKIDVRSVDVRSPCSAELRRNEKGQLCRGKLFPWC